MNISFKRIQAIFIKDYKEFSRNYAVSIVFLFPIIMAFLYSRMDGETSINQLFLLFNMTYAMIGTYVQSCLIAEEKDKDTLRGLLLSPASISDIMIGKSALSFVVTGVALILVGIIMNYQPSNLSVMIVASILSITFYIILGMFVGLFTKTVMEASVYSFPVIGLATIGSFAPILIENYPFLKIVEYLPSSQLVEIAVKVDQRSGFAQVGTELLIIVGWCLFVSLLTIVFYKKTYG